MTKRLLLVAVITFLSAAPLCAEDYTNWGVSLIAPNSLDGWNAGPDEPKGWHVENGVLIGEKGCTPLTSAWTFDDFAVFAASDDSGSNLSLQLIDASTGKSVYQTTGGNVGLNRKGTRIVDGFGGAAQPRIETPVLKEGHRYALRISIPNGSGKIKHLRVNEPRGASIFNGTDLTGWWTPGNVKGWAVEDGKIVCLNDKGDYLRTEKHYGNFTLSLEYNIAEGGNSGIGIRTPRLGWPSGDGMELQVEDRPADEPLNGQSPMAIYSNVPPFARADHSKQWNKVVIKAEGRMISAWMNGQLVQCVNTLWQPELKHRHLKGWIGFQDHNDHVEYRNIYVLEAPDGLGLAEWYAPRKPFGSQVVVERLMNPEALTSNDSLTVRTTQANITSQDEQVVAELKGPGAVVSIARSSKKGRVKFYFDGEQKARVECDADKLLDQIPALSRDDDPLLVYVPYASSLKVTLTGVKADYRMDYVAFDDSVRIEPFDGPDHTAMRGLLTATAYRLHQMNHGTLRNYDPSSKAASEKKTIEPGKKMPLAKLDGAGVVDWLRLKCPTKSLTNDDLWFEVTVDGEDSPAIAAPARYLFPGLTQGKNYRNFVVTSKMGFTQRLAMPYAQGLSIAVHNRGKRAVKDVEITVSYHPVTAEDASARPRLRGEFASLTAAAETSPTLKASWRLAGCVVSPTEGAEGSLWQWLELPRKPDEIRQALNGRSGGLAWRWWLLGSPQTSDVKEPDLPLESTSGRLLLHYAGGR